MKPKSRSAFSLVETTLALGVAAFCLTTILGLLPVGLTSNSTAVEQTTATNLLTAIAADLRNTPNPSPRGSAHLSPKYGISVPAFANGVAATSANAVTYYFAENGAVTNAADARYRVSSWMYAGEERKATQARLQVSWPAAATVENATGSIESIVALDRN
jgi:uncharacterized protein (TIGR02598 family)